MYCVREFNSIQFKALFRVDINREYNKRNKKKKKKEGFHPYPAYVN